MHVIDHAYKYNAYIKNWSPETETWIKKFSGLVSETGSVFFFGHVGVFLNIPTKFMLIIDISKKKTNYVRQSLAIRQRPLS